MAKKLKVSGNPQVAFMQGREIGRVDGVTRGYRATTYINLLALYNVNTEFKLLSGPKFKQLVVEMEKEIQRFYTDELKENEDGLSDLIISHSEQLREKMGLEHVVVNW